jgi:diphthine synthase
MVLYIIGLGLGDEQDITVKGLEAVKSCELVYLEDYTSKLGVDVGKLEKFYGKKIIFADRELVEKNADEILENAKSANVAFLVVGDVFSATTHHDLRMRAAANGIKIEVIHNASILTAIGDTGLDLYKFGRVCTLVFPEKGYSPDSFYDVIKQNLDNGLHTLCLLDIQSDKDKFMSITDGLNILLDIEGKRKENVIVSATMVVGCGGLGTANQKIKYGKVKDLIENDFSSMQCLVFPAKLHFVEQDVLNTYKM